MSILIVIFGLLSGCLLSVVVGIIGSGRQIGFGWAFVLSILFSPLIGLLITLLSNRLPDADKNWGCVGTMIALLGLLFFVAFLVVVIASGALLALV